MSEDSTNENEVSKWLKHVGCGEFIAKFYDAGYRDLETIAKLTKADLKEIGIVQGFAKTILVHAEKLEHEEPTTTTSKRRKRCVLCHHYTTKGHKKVCTGECKDFKTCPTQCILKHPEDSKKVKEEEKKKENVKRKKRKRNSKEKEKKPLNTKTFLFLDGISSLKNTRKE